MDNLTIRNASIIFKNFAGEERRYNSAGNRNFGVKLSPDIAEQLKEEGWNVKYLKPQTEDDDIQAWLPVAVAFGYKPPRIHLIDDGGDTLLDEETVEQLDWAEIDRIDLTIRPRVYEMHGSSGVKAYLKTMFVYLEVDELEAEFYAEHGEEE